MEHKRLGLNTVLEAGVSELADLCMSVHEYTSSQELFYAKVILHFLRGELKELALLCEAAKSTFVAENDHSQFLVSCLLRLKIRERSFDEQLISKALILGAGSTRWRGELFMLVGSLYGVDENFRLAQTWFNRAALALESEGVLKKALRARMNSLVCESHFDPERNLIASYHDLFHLSLKRNRHDLIVATTCLLNISREYQRAGAPLAALKYCSKGLELTENHFGSLNHHLLLAHRAHILLELNRPSEARIDYESIRLSGFPEVQAALEMLEPALSIPRSGAAKDPDLLPTWRERLEEANNGIVYATLSTLEQKLISFLAKGPKNRIDILEHLYGDRLSYETKLNRLKSLLSGLRKKQPDLVLYSDDQYRLADKILVPRSLPRSEGKRA